MIPIVHPRANAEAVASSVLLTAACAVPLFIYSVRKTPPLRPSSTCFQCPATRVFPASQRYEQGSPFSFHLRALTPLAGGGRVAHSAQTRQRSNREPLVTAVLCFWCPY